MELNTTREKLIQYAREIQLNTIDELKLVIDEAQKSANDYGAPKDRYDSYRNQLMRKRDMFAKQLKLAQDNLIALDKIPINKVFNNVEFGSIIITNRQKLFVSISLGKIELDGEEFYAISPHVPIFMAMKDKIKGDEINFNGNLIQILEVF